MAYEPKDLTGSLFKNDRREKDTHPHAKGTALINGVEFWVDAWTNEDRNGNKYQSLKFKVKEARPTEAQGTGGGYSTQRAGGAFDDDLSDDVPFLSCDPALEHRVR